MGYQTINIHIYIYFNLKKKYIFKQSLGVKKGIYMQPVHARISMTINVNATQFTNLNAFENKGFCAN